MRKVRDTKVVYLSLSYLAECLSAKMVSLLMALLLRLDRATICVCCQSAYKFRMVSYKAEFAEWRHFHYSRLTMDMFSNSKPTSLSAIPVVAIFGGSWEV